LNDLARAKALVLERVDLLGVVSRYVSLRRQGQRWVGLCPFHSEKTPSFTVSPDRGFFKCFGCGKGGDVFTFLQLREGLSFGEALRALAETANVQIDSHRPRTAGGHDRADLARLNGWAQQFFRDNLRHPARGEFVRKYIDSRGISPEMVERFGLGLATGGTPSLEEAARRAGFERGLLFSGDLLRDSSDGPPYETFRNRLMFPIRDPLGRVLGFGGRTLVDDRAKYLNTRQGELFDKGRGLFAIDLARDAIRASGRAVLVEGYTDCIALHQAGFAETVATLGTALTEAQVELLRRYGQELILLFDSDSAGESAAERAIRLALPRGLTVRLARVPEGKDPSELLGIAGPAAFPGMLNAAVDALEFQWSRLRDGLRAESSDVGRRQAVEEFLTLIGEVCAGGAMDTIMVGLVANRVARLLRIEPQDVHRHLSRTRSRPARGPAADTVRGGRRFDDGEQAAWAILLEVVLNEPCLLSEVDRLPDTDRIADPCDRRIAAGVVSAWAARGASGLQDMFAGCERPEDAQRVTELASRGADRGNYRATLAVALERIRRADEDRRLDALRHSATRSPDEVLPSEVDAPLAELQRRLMDRRGFSPKRHRRDITPRTTVPGSPGENPSLNEP
jgi:DNA primase